MLFRSVPMLLSKGLVKLRSLGVLPFVLVLASGVGGAGCFFADGHSGHSSLESGGGWDDQNPPDTSNPQPDPSVPQVSIQPDQVLDAKPGEGVGIFVEYRSGGKY